jgi:hypothetical protein
VEGRIRLSGEFPLTSGGLDEAQRPFRTVVGGVYEDRASVDAVLVESVTEDCRWEGRKSLYNNDVLRQRSFHTVQPGWIIGNEFLVWY